MLLFDVTWSLKDGGVQGVVEFDNGYSASIILSQLSYGHNDGLFEVAILKNGALCYDTHITSDVIGYQTLKEVEAILHQIKELKD